MLWAVILLAVVCAGLGSYIIMMKRQLRSMRRELAKTASADYDRRMMIALFDRDLNGLAEEINKSIDNQKRLKIDAEQAEITLRKSVSDIAHDLRTPLAVINGDLQLILREEQLTGRCREYAEVCLAKTGSLREMCDEFFELSVLESDRSRAELSCVNMTNLLMKFVVENEGVIKLAGLEPNIIFPPKTVFVMADESLVMRMLGNLLGNVLKYSRETFSVALGEDGKLIFSNPLEDDSVDTGRLFERTYRGSTSRSGSGAGLGLYIVRLLAEKQGAKVSAAAENGSLSVAVEFETVRVKDSPDSQS